VKNYVVIRLKDNRIVESATAIGSVGVCMRGVEAKWRETSKKGIVLKGRTYQIDRQSGSRRCIEQARLFSEDGAVA
jgi:hypothetical protein